MCWQVKYLEKKRPASTQWLGALNLLYFALQHSVRVTSYFLSVKLAGGPSCGVVNSGIVPLQWVADAGRAQPAAGPVPLPHRLGFHACGYSGFHRCACPASCSFPGVRAQGVLLGGSEVQKARKPLLFPVCCEEISHGLFSLPQMKKLP